MATILVVDDVQANRDYLVTLLGRIGHRLLQAADGSEALALAGDSHPDLIITDILMPTMDGYELVRRLRIDPALAHTPVIFWTAYYHERQAQTLARKCGVSVVITKPAEQALVLDAVEAALGLAPPSVPLEPAEQFDQEHMRLLTDKLSEKADDWRATTERLSAMIDLNLQLASEVDHRKLLQGFAHAARKIIGARYSMAGIVAGDGSRFPTLFTSGMDAETVRQLGSPDLGAPILEEILIEKRTVRTINPGGDPTTLGFSPGNPAIHAWLGAPITSPTRLFGYIAFIDKIGHDEFSAEDERLSGILAAQVGRIYQNGSLYTEAVGRAADLEREIAARALAQEQLRQSEAEYRLLFDKNPSPMWVTDVETHAFLAVNEAAIRHYGYSQEEFLGMTALDIRPASEALQYLTRIQAVNAMETPFGSEGVFKHRKKDGTIIDIEVAAGPILFHGRRARMTLSVDITERKQLEEQFQRAQRRLREVVISSPAVLFTMSIDRDQVRGISWTSENLLEVLGYPAEAALGMDWWVSKVHPEDVERITTQTGAELLTLGRTTQEYRFRHGDNSYRWTRCEMRLICDENGRPTEAVGAWSDITERKTAEDEHSKLREQLEQAQKLDGIGQLAGGIAHDFNNLLGVVIGYTEMIRDSLPKVDSPLHRYVANVLQSAGRGAEMTHQLLAFSRQQVLQPRVLSLTALVREFERMLRRVIPANVEIHTALGSTGQVRADAGQIEQVIMNLAVNARDAMPGGGRLTIETSDVVLDESYSRQHAAALPGPYVMLAVSDTGHGMTAEVQARIFEPFYTTKERGKGTGLGLGMVHGIVKQSGGFVYVYSEPDRGSTFKIYLPRLWEVIDAPPSLSSQEMPRGTETILVTEDEDGLRSFVSELLKGLGYTVLVAEHGAEALRIAEEHVATIHLLLTDVIMPGIGGRELADHLTKLRPSLKVLYLSGYTDDSVISQGVLAHEMAFLQKPFASSALAHKIREVLEGTPSSTG